MTTIPLPPPAPDLALRDCVVIGGGPAGIMAALYLQRFCRDVLVIDAGSSRTRWIDSTRNCPGFPYGIGGKELLERLRQQAEAHHVPITTDRVLRVRRGDGAHFVVESDTQAWPARTVIVASGIVDRLPAWPNVEASVHTGVVRLCAVCDAYEAEDKRIAVYGTADSGVGHAEFLRTYSTHVSLVLPPGASLSAADRARAQSLRVQVMHAPEERCALRDGKFSVDGHDGKTQAFDKVYISLGAVAQTRMLEGLGVLLVAEGEVQVDDHCETTVSGVYAIGDVVSALNQIGVAFGHAAIAATAIHNRLERNLRR